MNLKKETKEKKVENEVKSQGKKSWLSPILFLIIAGVAVWSFYNYLELKDQLVALTSVEGQQEFQEKELQGIVDKVSKHMLLPEDTLPTVASISNVETLKEQQPFFNNAENGDQLLVYIELEQAIIYRPSSDLIINVGPIAVDSSNQATAPAAPVAPAIDSSDSQ